MKLITKEQQKKVSENKKKKFNVKSIKKKQHPNEK